MITKVRNHLSQNEPLLFERSSPGKKAYQLPELDVPAVDAAEALGAENVRDGITLHRPTYCNEHMIALHIRPAERSRNVLYTTVPRDLPHQP